ncbi:MAG: C39 family peptidase [Patescibacteria group bacterium]
MIRNARKTRWGLVIVIILVLGAGVAYAERGRISDWLAEANKPMVPAVSYENVANPDDGGAAIPTETIPDEPTPTPEQETTIEPDPENIYVREPETAPAEPEDTSLPAEFNLAVPFTSQAPKSVWDEVHQETCEEASAYMAAEYLAGTPAGKIDPDVADAALMKIIEFENSFFGFNKDTTAAQTASLLEAYFNLNPELIVNPTADQIKAAIVAGHPVIVPAAGRELGNPNFTAPGPLYHMFVIKGYTAKGFITNDPGTRLGADYFYTFDVVMNAIHDWNGGDVGNGAKVVIVVKP